MFFYVITGVIALSFFVWGTGDIGPSQKSEQRGTIGGAPVTAEEIDALSNHVDIPAILDALGARTRMPYVQQSWMQQLAQIRHMLRTPSEAAGMLSYFGLDALRDLTTADGRTNMAWKWLAYIRAARAAGLTVQPEELKQFLQLTMQSVMPRASNEYYAPAPFSPEFYRIFVQSDQSIPIPALSMYISALSMPLPTFEKAVTEFLLVDKYFQLIADGADVSSQEMLDAYLDEAREVVVAWIGYDPKTVEAPPPPSREAIARYFQDRKGPAGGQGPFTIPAKAQIEFLLAEDDKYLDGIEAPSEAKIKEFYNTLVAKKDSDCIDPEKSKDGKTVFKTLDQMRGDLDKQLRRGDAFNKAMEILQKALFEIGALEAKQKQDPSVKVDFAALAARFNVACESTPYFSEDHVQDVEDLFGAFRDSTDRQAFQRKVFRDMKDGEVMVGELRPVRTKKGAIIYRLVHRKAARTPDQLTPEVEAEIVQTLTREARERRALDNARRVVDRVNAVGLSKAESELRVTLHRSPPLKAHDPLPNPSGDHEPFADGKQIVDRARGMAKANQAGKAQLVYGSSGTRYAVVPARMLEASMENFEKEKAWIRDKLLQTGYEGRQPVPGKRQKLIDARRMEIEKGIQRKAAEATPGDRQVPAKPRTTRK
jgi:hypothetical protein